MTTQADPSGRIIAAPAAPAEPDGSAGPDKLRTEIQALRALAVGSVMLYHLWPNRLPGGYVGVDVFFVISGFLITSHLVSEVTSTGRLRPGRFWARRAKRLIPASSLVLLATTVGIIVWVPRRLWDQFLTEIVASTLQAQNWVLARNSVDYLAANNPPSPTQHFWTLSVEEQFYVVLPLLLLATGLIRWRGDGRRRTIIGTSLAVVLVASLTYSIVLTSANPGLAYFSTFTRAWEFAVGAMLAFVPARRRTGAHVASTGAQRRRPLSTVAPWLGVVAIVVACFTFDGDTPFPGYAAALPVLGAAVVIGTGRGTALSRVGTLPPVALLGRVSYAAYLWHWSILVVLPFATGHPLTTTEKLGIIVASIVVAWASTSFVEDPIRFNPRLLGGRRPRVVAAWSAVPIVVVVALALTASHNETRRQEEVAAKSRDILGSQARCLGAQSMDPKLAPCENAVLDGVLIPDIARAAQDDANMSACWVSAGGTPNVCTLGATRGYKKKLLAIGDSHNNTLIDVYRTIAEQNEWRVDVSGSGGCYYTAADQVQPTDATRSGCQQWRDVRVPAMARRDHRCRPQRSLRRDRRHPLES